MSLTYNLITPPSVEPFTVEEAMSFLNVDDEGEEPLVIDLIKAAREYVELHTQRVLIRQTWQATIDSWPRYARAQGFRDCRRITLEKTPLISVDEVAYYDPENVKNVYLTDKYQWAPSGDGVFGFLERDHAADWPEVYDRANAISITFTAGYGPNGLYVPALLKQAMKLLIANYWEQRNPTSTVQVFTVPLSLEYLIASYRVGGYVA